MNLLDFCYPSLVCMYLCMYIPLFYKAKTNIEIGLVFNRWCHTGMLGIPYFTTCTS